MDPGFKAYVSAIDTFSKTEAENGSVPTLKYTENATGYYLLPEDVHNLSWGFYSSSTELGSVSKTGVIPTPESGNLYTLTFKYSKTRTVTWASPYRSIRTERSTKIPSSSARSRRSRATDSTSTR